MGVELAPPQRLSPSEHISKQSPMKETMIRTLLLCLPVTLAHVDIFAFKEQRGDQTNQIEETFGGGAPPDLSIASSSLSSSLSSSCSCSKLILSSLGPAATFQPHVMGIYTKTWTDYGGRESYRQNYGQDYRLYWLPSGWMVGDARGAPTGYVHNPDQSRSCAYGLPTGWLFYSPSHHSWFPDQTLVLRCI